MTRDYGNYEKYEKNSVSHELEKGEYDLGYDKLMKNDHEMNMRVKTLEKEQAEEDHQEGMEDLLSNDKYAD